ncbi:MAG: potassium transporter TrkH [Rhodobacteraceae bacterium]|nr:potassium transporter TrkH [Paracoccaceae bacterium]
MIDLRPVGYVIGILVALLGAAMFCPLLVDLAEGRGHWPAFMQSASITIGVGVLLSMACSNGVKQGLSIQQTFLLTTGVWLALPLFGALPFLFGATEARYIDAFFEAMSGLTTTGATVFYGLETLPKGLLLWRGILQWLGGIGIIVVAMVFLPELRVGGMQIFKAEAFDTLGKILPKATTIAMQISVIYIAITMLCVSAYFAVGMTPFDAVVHAMTTVATGGFSNYDASFGAFGIGAEYVCLTFMILSALPFVRYVQLINGSFFAVFSDVQVRTFIVLLFVLVFIAAAVVYKNFDYDGEVAFRKAFFNVTSIISGTGYSSADYTQWGGFLVTMFFFIGLIGGCAGSTACSVKIFRYQLVYASVSMQLRKIRSPNGVFIPRYDGRSIEDDVLSSVMSFFIFFMATLGIVAILLGMSGLDLTTSLSASSAALANIGPGLGDQIGPAGNYAGLNDFAKWVLSAAMLIGRLELLAVYAILTIQFWRA